MNAMHNWHTSNVYSDSVVFEGPCEIGQATEGSGSTLSATYLLVFDNVIVYSYIHFVFLSLR